MSYPPPLEPASPAEDLLDLPLDQTSDAPLAPQQRDARAEPPSPEPPSPEPTRSDRSSSRPARRLLGLLLFVSGAAIAAAGAWWLKPAPALVAPSVPMLDFQQVRIGAVVQRVLEIANRGESALAMTRTDLAGTDASDFTVLRDECSGRRLAQGEHCALEVAFRPTGRGRRTAVLALEGQAANAPRTVPLLGRGTAPELSAEPRSLAFGQVSLGAASTPQWLRLANRGTSPLKLSRVVIEGPGAGDFTHRLGACRARTLAPGDECRIELSFLPTREGSRQATLKLGGEDPAPDLRVSLRGEGLKPRPRLRLETQRLDLGATAIGAPLATSSLALYNDGSAPLRLETIELAGADALSFTLDARRCLQAPVPAGGGCTVDIAAQPTAVGPQTAEITIRADGAASSVVLAALGIAPQVRLVPLRLSLAEVPVDHRGTPATLRVENVGMAPLRIARTALEGGDRAAFMLLEDRCRGASVEPGGACTLGVGLKPRRPGPLRTTLVIVHNAGRERVPITGFGTAGRLRTEPQRLEFEQVVIGQSRERRLLLRNRGRAHLTLRPPRITGTDRAVFRISGSTCSAPLAPAESCTVTVAFLPVRAGARNAQLEIAHDGEGSEARVALRGQGQPPPRARVRVTPAHITFDGLPVGSRSEIETLTITNAGDVALRLRAMAVRGPQAEDFRLVPGSCSFDGVLAAGSSCMLGVRFTPSATGRRQARVELVQGDEGSRGVEVVGTGW